MPNEGGLQLLPETRKKIEIIIPGENRLLVIGAVVLAISAALAGSLYFYNNYLEDKLVSLDGKLAALEQNRNRQSEQNILVFNKQLSMLSNLLNKHAYWTTAFSKIEGLTQSQVQFDSLIAAAADNKIDFKATAANYTTIARQIAAFLSDESITDINLSKVNILTNGRLEFTMQISFNRSKFLQNK
ncbi:MAG: hypothetical protein A2655_03270 [Candidatus Yanofskybacteria bacterium RIFCSPHIGHO2_01_FULL_43_42]|uniref:Fimbrial assembly protein n=1 Tax=Candidatus Yanofskybacteria bacterium RIFCSPLOWO2_01_FULL_43_22 TaxID=1802695 RepID=A0A1F8GF31_9BACT|nr:MAG: hypothetical protein A2655_03270 [Candidatus Yanofskybacteria bacterium RIFCSPHIGHO2_01_FULL_43_42]OGN13018.1 MAG: hypothetical protein A3D48_03930 [Candidatus Yanofskybacteria bacterium RIFCSPHIGHO2_02_FULL_43_17]OGN23901.1 MAG: hypothetical protein A3A13_02325 [Candidatus Yanofskybacteria bacterium RIFCSPLOWO2_01_FULL_43_22]